MNPPHAVIAGAGIGGLCTSLSLALRGWRVSLYEKAKVLEETGAGLQLSPNASAILGKLGVIERLTPFALRPKAIKIRRARDGATLALMPLDDAERRWGAPYLVVHRADLQRALLETIAREPSIRTPNRGSRRGLCYRRRLRRNCRRARRGPAEGGGRLPDRRGRSALLRAAKARRR